MNDLSLYDFPALCGEAADRRRAMLAIASAPRKTAEAKRLADPSRPGWSWKRLHSLYQAWEASGRSDLVLLDHRKSPRLRKASKQTLPAEFLEWAGGQMLANQRKSRPAYRAIVRRWQQWRTTQDTSLRIPGYEVPPPPAKGAVPAGWSYRQLMRRAQPPKVELAIARIGTVAAKAHLPFIPSTREGLRFLEVIYGDDVVHDRKIIVPGFIHPVRILQLGLLDHASGVYLKFGMRPDLPREDGTRDRLKRRDFLFLIAHTLIEYGYPADYPMHIVVERATATMSKAEAQFLHDISGGQIRVGWTSMQGAFVLAWDEQASGNPQGKGALESFHNLFHNEMASLPGQVGKDRDHSPAALYGSDREAVALNKAALLLTPEQRKNLRTPYATFAQAHRETLDVVARINRRTDHAMEGFEHVMQWRISGVPMEWQPEAGLATLDPALTDRLEYLPRLESPIERMQRLSLGVRFIKPHPGALIRFYEDSHTPAKITGCMARVTIEKRSYTFGPDSPEGQLPEGAEVTLHHAPIEPTFALVTHRGEFVGVWSRQLAPRVDADALSTSIRKKQTFLNHAMSSVRGKMLEKLVEQDRRLSDNIDTLEASGVLPSEADFNLALAEPQSPGNAISEAMQEATKTLARHTRDEKSAHKAAVRDARESLLRRASNLADAEDC